MKVFFQSKRGALGITILAFSTILAIFGPLLTINDPIKDSFVAGNYAAPSWFKYLPGNQDLSENMLLLTNSSFPTAASLKEWEIEQSSPDILLQHDTRGSSWGEGSIAITLKEAQATPSTEYTASIRKNFTWPYGRPKRFRGIITWFVTGTGITETTILGEEKTRLDMPVRISTFLINETGYKFELWNRTIKYTTKSWDTTSQIDSFSRSLQDLYPYDPAKVFFSKPSNYTYGVEVTFNTTKLSIPKEESIETTIYIDDLNLRFYGNSYGLLGTDWNGRDLYSQLITGTRISLIVGLTSAAIGVGVGLIVGLVSGYIGGIVDEILMRFTDMLLILPGLPLLLVLVAVMGSSIWNIIFIIGLLGWMSFARVIRSQVLTLKERPFIEAAKSVGAGKFHILFKHIMPNIVSFVYVNLATYVPAAILSEAALSWLGLFDPKVMSWGRMLYDAQVHAGYSYWWWVVPPGLAIAIVSLSFILMGYALDEVLNPRLRVRR